MIALALALGKCGKKVYATVQTKRGLGVPAFLNGISGLITPKEASKKKFDLFVSIDCADMMRIPEEIRSLAEKCGGYGVNIDHHHTNTGFAKVNWVRGNASSAGEMIWRLIKDAKLEWDRDIAEALWVALITDTGRFAYDLTAPATLRCAADLVEHGVRTSYINDKIYCTVSKTTIELKKRAYRSLHIAGDIAYTFLSGKDFRETGGDKSDVEDVIDIPRSIVGNRIALFFYEAPNDESETRISIRTRDNLDASSLAALFGGGGHLRAAGCSIMLPLRKAISEFLKATNAWYKTQK